MDSQVKKILGTRKFKPTGQCGGGCINQGESYDTDSGRVYVKLNHKEGAKVMFEGEFASLEAIRATKTIRVPQPLHVVTADTGSSAALVMEALSLRSTGKYQRDLGKKLALLHKHNMTLIEKGDPSAVRRFGFPITTCCGYLTLNNSWKDDWVEFYIENRIEPQIKMLEEKNEEIRELWSRLREKIPALFNNIEVVPALLHGDLWSGNKAELENEPVVFDPASFYGHSEFEFGIIQMFGGFDHSFFEGYRSILPKESGFEERCNLYELFHHLNHWNTFGSGYKRSSVELLKKLAG